MADLVAKNGLTPPTLECAPKRRKTPYKWSICRHFRKSQKSWVVTYDFFKKYEILNKAKTEAKTPYKWPI